jgi:hypothetical protein
MRRRSKISITVGNHNPAQALMGLILQEVATVVPHLPAELTIVFDKGEYGHRDQGRKDVLLHSSVETGEG